MKLITPENLYESVRCGDGIEFAGPIQILFDTKHYNDDVLDVSALFPFADPMKCKVDFRKLPPALLGPGRSYARLLMFYGAAPATAQAKLNSLILLSKEMAKLGLEANVNTLSMDEIEAVTNAKNISDDCCYRICVAVHSLLTIFKSVYKNEYFAMDLKALAILRAGFGKVCRNGKNAGKTPDIDEEFFEIVNERMPGIIWNESIPYNYRITAAVILLEMWLGLRRSELFRLSKDATIIRKSTNGRYFPFIRYGVPKLSNGGRKMKYNETYMLPAAISAFDSLLSLREMNPESKNTDLLIIYPGAILNTESMYSYYAPRLFRQFFSDISLGEQNWNFVKKHPVKQCGVVYYPTVTQYRVHLCGFLYRQGIKHHIIELGMSHLSSAMASYYYRVKDTTFQKERSLVDRKIRTSINNDFDIVDHEELGEILSRDLIYFIAQYRVYQEQFNKMIERGKSYEYEAFRYADKLRILIDTRIMPTIEYIERRLVTTSEEDILATHPMLKYILPNIENIIVELDECKRNLKPYLKNSEDIPVLTRQD